jgi:segregation and condensation protein A
MEGATVETAVGDLAADDPAWNDWENPLRTPAAGVPAIPVLHLDGFDGPMDLLLDLAERQRIDFGRMSVLALAEQFVAALEQLADRVAIERRADWLVMATRLVLLRSRLLCPESPVAADAAQRDAAAELRRIDDLAKVRAAAVWLGEQPVLGLDVFARGAPDRLGVYVEREDEVDVIAFLWASMALFEDDAEQPETVALYRPSWTDLYSVAKARARILRILGEGGDGEALEHFLPEVSATANAKDPLAGKLRLYSAWATTFSASLELAKQGDAALAQEKAFQPIYLRRPTVPLPA